MKKYTKEFVMLCTDWISGREQDKSKFNKYHTQMMLESKNDTSYRIWNFEGDELKDVLFNEGELEIECNPIESCFTIENNVNPFSDEIQDLDYVQIDNIMRFISPYVDTMRIITRWSNSDVFEIYKVLEYTLDNYDDKDSDFSEDEIHYINKTLQKFEHQEEVLHLNKYSSISKDEVLYLLVSTEYIEYYLQDKSLENLVYAETENYTMFYVDETMRETFRNSKIMIEFQNMQDLFSPSFTITKEQEMAIFN